MKINKNVIINLILFMFVCNMRVNAYSNNITINTAGDMLTLTDDGSTVTIGNSNKYPWFHVKNSNEGTVICLSGTQVDAPGSGSTCELKSSSEYGVAYIIDLISKTNANDNEKYYWQEILVNGYLETLEQLRNPQSATYINIISQNDRKILNTGKSFSEIINEAKTYSNNASIKANISVNGKKTIDLTFTKGNDGYYYSNNVTITSNVVYEMGTIQNTKFTYDKNQDGTYTFKIKSVDVSDVESFSHEVTVSKRYMTASRYYCGAGVQEVSLTKIETPSTQDSITIKGSVKKSTGTLIINKFDKNNVLLSGAKILVTGTNGYNQEFITNGTPIIIEDLEYGVYSVEETMAPVGYTLSSAKKVTLSELNKSLTVNLVDDEIKISIVKVNNNNSPLAGAILQITDKEGNVVNYCGENKNSQCKWTTTEDEYVITKIPSGIYYLEELETPVGYDVIKGKKKIEISDEGKITFDGKEINSSVVKFINDLTKTEISKINAVDGKELPGATLQILNSGEEKMSCIILNEEGKEETLKECTWVSKENATIVMGLPAGKYYLVELIAPEGYALNENKVEFEVKADGTVTEVEMKNDLEVKVPNTLSSRSALLIAISMFDIALGIGILTYVKKNKIRE